MKTVKMGFLFLAILAFTTKVANGQPPIRWSWPTVNFSYESACIDETLIGDLFSESQWGNNYSEKTTGTLYGEISGEEYSFENIWQGHWWDAFENGLVNSHAEYIVTLRKDEKVFSIAHYRMNFKLTPSGQEVSSELLFENCKKIK